MEVLMKFEGWYPKYCYGFGWLSTKRYQFHTVPLFFSRWSFSHAINICAISIFLPEYDFCLITKHKSAVHQIARYSRTTLQHFKQGGKKRSDPATLSSFIYFALYEVTSYLEFPSKLRAASYLALVFNV